MFSAINSASAIRPLWPIPLAAKLMDGPLVINRQLAGLIALVAVGIVAWFFDAIIRNNQRSKPVPRRRRGLKALVIGVDNRASTSKLQASLWTVAVVFALTYMLFLGRSTACGAEQFRDSSRCNAARSFDLIEIISEPLQAQYFVLLGFPLAAALGAKALTTSKIAGGSLTKDKASDTEKGTTKGLAEAVSNDRGEIDLLDFQYFAFNLLALGFFFIQFLTKPFDGLPALPATLIALAGLSAATYTTKKALETDEKPGITTVIPHRVPLVVGQLIVIRGTGFQRTPPPEDPMDRRITLDGVIFPEAEIEWSPTRIEVKVTDAMIQTSRAKADGAPVEAELQVDLGSDSFPCEPYTIEVYKPLEPAVPSAAVVEGTDVTEESEG
jgi:hypothetical protein